MKKYFVILGIVALLVANSCNKPDDSCDEEKLTAALVIDYPDTVSVGSAFNLGINYIVENSCGDFGKFDAERYGNTLEVRLKTYYTGCNCIEEFEEKSVNYPVIFEEEGTYELKFWIAESEYETYVVVAE